MRHARRPVGYNTARAGILHPPGTTLAGVDGALAARAAPGAIFALAAATVARAPDAPHGIPRAGAGSCRRFFFGDRDSSPGQRLRPRSPRRGVGCHPKPWLEVTPPDPAWEYPRLCGLDPPNPSASRFPSVSLCLLFRPHSSSIVRHSSRALCVSAVNGSSSTRFTPRGRGHRRGAPRGRGRPDSASVAGFHGKHSARIPSTRRTQRRPACQRHAALQIAPRHIYAAESALSACPRASHDPARGRYRGSRGTVHALHTVPDVDIRRDRAPRRTPRPDARISRASILTSAYSPSGTPSTPI